MSEESLKSQDKEELKRRLELLQKEYERTAQRLQRAESREAVRKHVQNTVVRENRLLHLNTSSVLDQNSSSSPEQLPTNLNVPSDTTKVRFCLPDASPFSTLTCNPTPSRTHRLRSKRSRLRLQIRERESDTEESQEKAKEGTEERRSEERGESERVGQDEDVERGRSEEEEKNTEKTEMKRNGERVTVMILPSAAQSVCVHQSPLMKLSEGNLPPEDKSAARNSPSGSSDRSNPSTQSLGRSCSPRVIATGSSDILTSCTLIEGLPFPVEYYVRTTRRMASAHSSVDMNAVIQSQLSNGRGRRRSNRGRTAPRPPSEKPPEQSGCGKRSRRGRRGRRRPRESDSPESVLQSPSSLPQEQPEPVLSPGPSSDPVPESQSRVGSPDSQVYPMFRKSRGRAGLSRSHIPPRNNDSSHLLSSLSNLTQALRTKDFRNLSAPLTKFDVQDFHLPDDEFGQLKLERLCSSCSNVESLVYNTCFRNTGGANTSGGDQVEHEEVVLSSLPQSAALESNLPRTCTETGNVDQSECEIRDLSHRSVTNQSEMQHNGEEVKHTQPIKSHNPSASRSLMLNLSMSLTSHTQADHNLSVISLGSTPNILTTSPSSELTPFLRSSDHDAASDTSAVEVRNDTSEIQNEEIISVSVNPEVQIQGCVSEHTYSRSYGADLSNMEIQTPEQVNNPPLFNHDSPLSQNNPPLSHHDSPLSQNNPPLSHHDSPLSHHESLLSHHESLLSHHDSPLSNHDSPLSHHESLLSHHESPLSHHESLLSHHDSPLSNHDSPLSHHESLLSHHDSPLSHHDSPLSHHDSPLSHHESLLSHHDLPLSHHESLLSHHDSPLYQNNPPLSHHDSPLSHHESLFSHHDSPLSHHESLLSHHDSPLSHHDSPLSHHESLLSHHDSPISHHDSPLSQNNPPLSHHDSPLYQNNPPLSHHDSPLSHHDSPLSHHESLLSHHDSPLSHHDSPLSQNNSPLSNHDSPLSHHDSPLSQNNPPLSSHDSPLSHHDSPHSQNNPPLSNHDSPLSDHDSPLSHHDSPLSYHDSPHSQNNPPLFNHDSPLSQNPLLSHHDSLLSHHDSPLSQNNPPISHHDSPISQNPLLSHHDSPLSQKYPLNFQDEHIISENEIPVSHNKDGLSRNEHTLSVNRSNLSQNNPRLSQNNLSPSEISCPFSPNNPLSESALNTNTMDPAESFSMSDLDFHSQIPSPHGDIDTELTNETSALAANQGEDIRISNVVKTHTGDSQNRQVEILSCGSLRKTHTLKASDGGCVLDVCVLRWPSEDRCVCVAGEWSVCVWKQNSGDQEWSLLYTWTFTQSVISLQGIPDSSALLCVCLGRLEITEARILYCPDTESRFLQAEMCKGALQAVLAVSDRRVTCCSSPGPQQNIQVFALAQDGRITDTLSLVSTHQTVQSLVVVEEEKDALIGWTEHKSLLIWNMKSGQLLQTIGLDESVSTATCLRGYSYRGALCVLLQQASACHEESSCTLFTLIATNPLTGKSFTLRTITCPSDPTERLIDGDVCESALVGVFQSGLTIWNLAGGVACVYANEPSEVCRLARWAGPNTLLTGYLSGDVSVYEFTATTEQPGGVTAPHHQQ